MLCEHEGSKAIARIHCKKFPGLWEEADASRLDVEDARYTLAGLRGT